MMTLEILLLLACLAAGAFFAGMETGIISINRLRLQHLVRRQVPGAKTVRHFLTHSDLLLGTTLIGTNLLQVVSAILVVVRLLRTEDAYRLTPRLIRFHRHETGLILRIGLPAGLPVVVEYCTNLANPIWVPLQTRTNGPFYFGDARWTNRPGCYYRVRQQ